MQQEFPSLKQKPPSQKRSKCYYCAFVVVVVVTAAAEVYLLFNSVSNNAPDDAVTRSTVNSNLKEPPKERCAINFFGLPRSFESLVLPSIIKHVIEPNSGCDYYVHYYHMTEEAAGRSGQGGVINPTAILLLKDAVLEAAASRGEYAPIVEFVYDTDADFWKLYKDLIEKIRTTKVSGKYLYFPWKARTYQHPVTTDNIVKMWHSIQSVYQLMERTATATKNIQYTTVAMLRSDVVYANPIDIHDAASKNDSSSSSSPSGAKQHQPVTIPNFGKHPVSDRIIYGPAAAVKIWATERFARLESHVQYVQEHDPGWGMHSERFMNTTIFPAIREIAITVRQHPTLCFLRARADETVWVSDCEGPASVSAPSIRRALGDDMRLVVERAIGRKCRGEITRLSKNVKSLDCSRESSPQPKTTLGGSIAQR